MYIYIYFTYTLSVESYTTCSTAAARGANAATAGWEAHAELMTTIFPSPQEVGVPYMCEPVSAHSN